MTMRHFTGFRFRKRLPAEFGGERMYVTGRADMRVFKPGWRGCARGPPQGGAEGQSCPTQSAGQGARRRTLAERQGGARRRRGARATAARRRSGPVRGRGARRGGAPGARRRAARRLPHRVGGERRRGRRLSGRRSRLPITLRPSPAAIRTARRHAPSGAYLTILRFGRRTSGGADGRGGTAAGTVLPGPGSGGVSSWSPNIIP